jgi:RNA polymerase sigma-70 factor, ECF subfamily
MAARSASNASNALKLSEAELVERIARRDEAAFEALMRRYNGQLFRVARAILKDDAEAEDALQEAYLDAYRHMGEFRGGARLATWLTRIVVNHALMRLRRRKGARVVALDEWQDSRPSGREAEIADETSESPAGATLRTEIRRLIERQIDELPLDFRTVFVMRDVDDMTVEETAAALDIPAATVRSRLFRARARLRESLARELDSATLDVFAFDGERCDRIVEAVLSGTQDASSSSNP